MLLRKRTKVVPIISEDLLVRNDLTTSLNRGDKILAILSNIKHLHSVTSLFFLSCQQCWLIKVINLLL